MLACRLCLNFGEQDPEQWLENCPKRVLSIWRAFAEAEGWFTERHLLAQTAIATRRLLLTKYDHDKRETVIRSIFDEARGYLPVPVEKAKTESNLNVALLEAAAKDKAELTSEIFSTETEIEGDLWQQR